MKSRLFAFAMMARVLAPHGLAADTSVDTSTAETTAAEDTRADVWELEGEGITVVSPPKPITTVRGDGEALKDAEPGGLGRALAEEAGLAQSSYGAHGSVSGFSLRGFSQNRVTVYLDGVALNSPQTGDADLSWIDPSMLEAADIEYGTAAGGAVRLTLAKPYTEGQTYGIRATNLSYAPARDANGLADAQSLSASMARASEDVSWKAGIYGTRADNAFPYTPDSGARAFREGSRALDGGAYVSASTRPHGRSTLSILGAGYLADKEIPGNVYGTGKGAQRETRSHSSIAYRADPTPEEDSSLEVSVAHGYAALDWEGVSERARHVMNTAHLHARGERSLSDRLSAGLDLAGRLSWARSSAIGNRERSEIAPSFYVESRPSDRLAIRLSGSILSVSGQDVTPVPSIGAAYSPATGTALTLAAYRAFKAPDLNALYWSGDPTARGNPDLDNEDGWGGEFKASWKPSSTLLASHTVFGTWYENAVTWQSSGGALTAENVGEALYLGSEHTLARAVRRGLSFRLSYSFMRTWLLTGDYDFSDGKRVPYQSEHRVNATVAFKGTRWRARINGTFESERFVSIVNVLALEPYLTVNARIDRDIGKGTSVFVDGRNILGASYQTIDGYPMPGASITVGLVYSR